MVFTFINVIGYIASGVVLLSFTMKDVKKLRIINSFGCAFFIYYGVLLNNDLPIIITNLVILLLNLYYLLVKK